MRIDEIVIDQEFTHYINSDRKESEYPENIGTPIIRKSYKKTYEFLSNITESIGVNKNVLPPNCRYFETMPTGDTLVVIEEPPCYRTISVSFSFQKELEFLELQDKIEEWNIDKKYFENPKNAPYKFNLAFPYVIFIFLFGPNYALKIGQAFVRSGRLLGFSDYLSKIPLMNISSDQNICFGPGIRNECHSLNETIENAIMTFWSAPFNPDYMYNYNCYKNTAGISTYIGWHALSQKDPMFIYSVNWIEHDKNLYESIKYIKDNHVRHNNFDFEKLTKIFTSPKDSGLYAQANKNSKRTYQLYYDIASGMQLDDIYCHIGDSFMLGKNKVFINSFAGFKETGRIKYIRCEFEKNAKRINVKITQKLLNYVREKIISTRFLNKGILKNGQEIKPEDFISIKFTNGSKRYFKVGYIRNTEDGLTEVQLGTMFYILENIDAEVFNLDAISINGETLNQTDRYLYYNINSEGKIITKLLTWVSCDIDSYTSEIKIKFRTILKGNEVYDFMSLTLENLNNMPPNRYFEKESNFTPAPPIFVNYDTIWKQTQPLPSSWYKNKIFHSTEKHNKPSYEEIYEHCMVNNGTTFQIDCNMLNISFNIGDKVVVSNWRDPLGMLQVKTITTFLRNSEDESISFVMTDKHGNISTEKYVYMLNGIPKINIGKVRKIVNTFQGVTTGTKIIAKAGYICNFPKKDVNIIIGFITDTGGEPLVLCSNGCTLWFSDMIKDFKMIKRTSKRWENLSHVPIDITKITVQPGDIVMSKYYNRRFLAVKKEYLKATRIVRLDSHVESTEPCMNVILDCIPNPRISKVEQTRKEIVSATPNLHGLFYKHTTRPSNANLYLADERSIINV